LSARLACLNKVVGEKNMSGVEQFSPFGGKQFSRFVADGVRPLNRIPGEVLVSPATESKLVKDGRRYRRHQRCREKAWISLNSAVPTARPIRDARLRGCGPVTLLCPSERRFVVGIEVVI